MKVLLRTTGWCGILLLVGGCQYRASTDPSYMASQSYQARPVMETTLFAGDEEILGGDSIERILTTRVVIPGGCRLAVLPLCAVAGHAYWSEDAVALDQESESSFLAALRESSRLADVSPLPGLLVPGRKGIPQLREAAARYQAHLLLVYATRFDTFAKYRLLGKDETRLYCAVEAALLDVRTGVVPFTSMSLQRYRVERGRDDLNSWEAQMRARSLAESKALTEIAGDLVRFLDAVPAGDPG